MAEEKKAEDKEGFTVLQIQEMIVGSPEKMALLNVFNGLMQENALLKKQLKEKSDDKT